MCFECSLCISLYAVDISNGYNRSDTGVFFPVAYARLSVHSYFFLVILLSWCVQDVCKKRTKKKVKKSDSYKILPFDCVYNIIFRTTQMPLFSQVFTNIINNKAWTRRTTTTTTVAANSDYSFPDELFKLCSGTHIVLLRDTLHNIKI